MSLPDAWVDRIFDKLTLVYGHAFLSRWDGESIAKVKASWAEELSRFQQNPSALAYALENLPVKPPSVLEFRALCNSPQAPRDQQALLPPVISRYDEDNRAWQRHFARLQEVRAQGIPRAYEWAYALKLKDEDPTENRKVSPRARAMYREVIANHQRLAGRIEE